MYANILYLNGKVYPEIGIYFIDRDMAIVDRDIVDRDRDIDKELESTNTWKYIYLNKTDQLI